MHEWRYAESIPDDFLERLVQGGSNEEKGAQAMQVSLYAYAKVMCKRMCDVVPQMVHTALVADVAQHLQPHLLEAMSTERLHEGAVDSKSMAKRRAAAEQLGAAAEELQGCGAAAEHTRLKAHSLLACALLALACAHQVTPARWLT
jgi:hypothetical protein